MAETKAIPEEWIKSYVDQLIEIASKYEPSSSMRAALLLRADNVMDLVKAWRESQKRKAGSHEA